MNDPSSPFSGNIPFENHDKWTRRYLPHYNASGIYQMLTFRLADSLPEDVAKRLAEEHKDDVARRKAMEAYLDAGHGSCILKLAACALLVIQALRFFDKQRYELIAWVIMPNHVHVIILTYPHWPHGKVLHSWKSWSAKEILKHLENTSGGTPGLPANTSGGTPGLPANTSGGTPGLPGEQHVWQREGMDRFIRDEKHFLSAINYIHQNPVAAGLVKEAKDWPWSSWHERNTPGGTPGLPGGH
jgi:putative transposase